MVNDDQLERRKELRIPGNTKANLRWAVNTWCEWNEITVERNEKAKNIGCVDKYSKVDPCILNHRGEELNYWLSKFVMEVRKKKDQGAECTLNTLYQNCSGVQRHLRDNGRPGINVFEDFSFKQFQDCLDAEMKRLTSTGVGSSVKQAEAFLEEQEEKLWKMGILGDHSPNVL